MALLTLVGAVVGIDIAAKLTGQATITDILRRNRAEAYIGLVWLLVHISKQEGTDHVEPR